jgi:acetylornithine deacetylase
MGRVLNHLERLDRDLQSRPPHPLMATASLHASVIQGGRELSSYPDRCRLQLERRTISGENVDTFRAELDDIVARLHAEDREFDAEVTMMFSRPPYEVPAAHELPRALARAAAATGAARSVGMSFWTDAAILGTAGIPTVLFGPSGAGLHSTAEYVELSSVIKCRDALASLALAWS